MALTRACRVAAVEAQPPRYGLSRVTAAPKLAPVLRRGTIQDDADTIATYTLPTAATEASGVLAPRPPAPCARPRAPGASRSR